MIKTIALVVTMAVLMLIAGCAASKPDTPAGLAVTGSAPVTLSWDGVSGATSYNVYRSTTSGDRSTKAFLANVADTTYVDTQAITGITYFYQITAMHSGVGESPATYEVSSSSAPPKGVTATSGDGKATIAWTAVSGATSYNIYWSTNTGVTAANGTMIAGVTTPYIQTGLTNGTTYYYVVTAVNGSGETNSSTQASCTPGQQAPSAPTLVTATPGDGQTTIAWAAVSGATSYNVYWSVTSGVTPANGTVITGATTPCIQTGLTNGTVRYYVVTAVNATGESSASSQVSAIPAAAPSPAAPPGVTATLGNTKVTIAWTPVPGATSYTIYWSKAAGMTPATAIVVTGTSSYTQTGLTNGTTYYFVVTAVNGNGESTASSRVSATPAVVLPTAPLGVTATPANSQVTIAWTPVTGATSYNIYWSKMPGVPLAAAIPVDAATVTYTQTGLSNGTTFYYVVTAVNGNGESTASSQVSATPAAP